jgi:hypothetical protein
LPENLSLPTAHHASLFPFSLSLHTAKKTEISYNSASKENCIVENPKTRVYSIAKTIHDKRLTTEYLVALPFKKLDLRG